MLLTHRTNVLFSSQEFARYSELAKAKNWSLSQMIRDALAEKYQSENDQEDLVESTQKLWKLLINPHKKLNYKKLVEDGRKY